MLEKIMKCIQELEKALLNGDKEKVKHFKKELNRLITEYLK